MYNTLLITSFRSFCVVQFSKGSKDSLYVVIITVFYQLKSFFTQVNAGFIISYTIKFATFQLVNDFYFSVTSEGQKVKTKIPKSLNFATPKKQYYTVGLVLVSRQ